tara:strand:- start:1595 stop:2518 length:924 start_codon:yes stop_codon:yes gene_type:complete
MGFLDNSGDIILDAVLTDTGRFRLAKGDGSFKIAKFALGDDEINYENYNGSHANGSAFYDLNILRTPVLEAFTNNGSSMKSKLVSIARNNLKYLPIIKLQDGSPSGMTPTQMPGTAMTDTDFYFLTTTNDTQKTLANTTGLLNGTSTAGDNVIRFDQGLDTDEISYVNDLDIDLTETQYIVEMDNKLMSLRRPDNVLLEPNFVDDDQIATYLITADAHPSMVSSIEAQDADSDSGHVIQGPRGTCLMLKLKATQDLEASNHLFTKLGGTSNVGSANTACKHIDTILRVHGATTGYSIDVPVRLIKKS